MNWNLFLGAITWMLTGVSVIGVVFVGAYWYSCWDADSRASTAVKVTVITSSIGLILGVAIISGMGWLA